MEKYRDGEKRAAFRVLGRVAHILEDMTSPAHIHNDPHGHLDLVGGDRSIGDCSFDIDDFETWGFCQRPSGKTNHILDYFRYQSETGDTSNLTDSRFINSFGR